MTEESSLALIPRPSLLKFTGGVFPIPERLRVAAPGSERERDFACRVLSEDTRRNVEPADGESSSVTLALTSDRSPHGGRSDEAYSLDVSSQGISVTACGSAGLFYGVQTLRQLLSPERPGIPCLHIEDAPRFQWRGMHLDVSRHFFNPAFVRRYIDLLAEHKLNVFHWHLSDDDGWRLEIDAFPELTERAAWRGKHEALPPSYESGDARYGGYYTKVEVRDIIAYAAERHVTVVPEIDVPGHSRPIAVCHPGLLCEGDLTGFKSVQDVAENLLCAGREETFAFLEKIIGEVTDLFPSPYLHMGGDERPEGPWEQCPRCAARIASEGLADTGQLQGYFMERVGRMVEAAGRRLIGWNEITHGGLVSTSATVMAWQDPEKGAEAAAAGYPVIMAPAQHTYFDLAQSDDPGEPGLRWAGVLPLEKAYRWSPFPQSATREARARILGIHGCLWSETLVSEARAEYMAFPRMCALAEIAWTPENRQSWPDFNTRLGSGHFRRLDSRRVGYRNPGSLSQI